MVYLPTFGVFTYIWGYIDGKCYHIHIYICVYIYVYIYAIHGSYGYLTII